MDSFEGALFDLDGTLVDTGTGIINAAKEIIVSRGYEPPSIRELRSFVGPPIQCSFQERFRLSKDEADAWAADFRSIYATDYLLDAQPYEGIFESLSFLEQSGIPMAVATYKRESYATTLLESFGFLDYIHFVFGSDPEGKKKKADIIEDALHSTKMNPSETILFGDTKHDLEGAKQAGVSFCAVTYGYGFTEQDRIEDSVCIGRAASPKEITTFFS